MRIMVFDVPAEFGGALTVLNQYYDQAINDKSTAWIFVVSVPKLIETENVKVLRYPWIKKSWLHRLYFDKFIAHKLVKQYDIDEVLSLQNLVIPKVKVKQTVYLHQSLPFSEKRFRFKENLKFWIYQNIMDKMIIKSIRKSNTVIVQTKWIRDVAANKAKVSTQKFVVKQPKLNIDVKKVYEINKHVNPVFFYPASGQVYKNHGVVLKACKILIEQGISDFKVVLTLKGDENKHIRQLKEYSLNEKLPVEFIGKLTIHEVYEYYSKSILLFPSYIETFGLPLLEARVHNTPIIASDCAFSKEVLEGYSNAVFFNPFSEEDLSNLMKQKLYAIYDYQK